MMGAELWEQDYGSRIMKTEAMILLLSPLHTPSMPTTFKLPALSSSFCFHHSALPFFLLLPLAPSRLSVKVSGPSYFIVSAFQTFGGDIGRSVSRRPVAAWMALATVAGGGTM